MKTAIAIALLVFTLTAPASAKDERAKLTTPNKSIDQGMKEAGEKPDIASSKTSEVPVPKTNTGAQKDKDIQRMSK
jgi:hypothetical protein